MMSLLLYVYFMSLCFTSGVSSYLFQFMLLLLMIIILTFSKSSFFSFISYNLGLDYYSYGLILLSLLIISLMVIASNKVFNSSESFFLKVNLILCLCLILVFSSLNILIMYFFFEFSLIPLLILIFIWGYQPERLISGLYLFFYTLFASLPFLLVIVYLLLNMMTLYFEMQFFMLNSFMVYLFTIFAFMVKLPMFMVHFWLPSAHVQAPVSGSMILAGLLLSIGGYGLIRLMVLCEVMFYNYSYVWYSFSIVGCILVSLVCLTQGDVKCLIAYSSVSHMGLCLAGILTMSKWGLLGSFLMMISHGLCSSALFCLANFSYDRYYSRSFYLNKGLINLMPSMSFLWFLICCFNMSCPPSMNFFSEVFILNSMLSYWSNSFIYFIFISFFSACFSYFLYSYTQHGVPHLFYSGSIGSMREYLLIMVHSLPLIILMLSLSFFF